jgi:AraC-like DNA-binding protein
MHLVSIYFMEMPFPTARVHAWTSTHYPSSDEFVSPNRWFPRWGCVAAESGRFRYRTEDVTGHFESGEAGLGDLVFAAPDRIFERRVTSAPLAYHVLQWSFVGEGGEVADECWRAGKWPVRDTVRLGSTLALLRHLPRRPDGWINRRREHLIEDLLHLAWQAQQEPPVQDALMRDAAQLMREKAGRALAMTDISRAVGLGPVQFTRRFRAAWGQNPIEFLTAVRLENAQKMLIETAEPLDEIAWRCGWSSGAYLSSVFERKLGTTPGRFRRAHRV